MGRKLIKLDERQSRALANAADALNAQTGRAWELVDKAKAGKRIPRRELEDFIFAAKGCADAAIGQLQQLEAYLRERF